MLVAVNRPPAIAKAAECCDKRVNLAREAPIKETVQGTKIHHRHSIPHTDVFPVPSQGGDTPLHGTSATHLIEPEIAEY